MPVVIFPGNVGDDGALATVYKRLAGEGVAASSRHNARHDACLPV
jgi:hypothetical protein